MLEKIETFERFSPTIMQFKVSDRFVNIVNTTGDAVLPDDGLPRSLIFQIVLLVKFLKKLEYQYLMKMIKNIINLHSKMVV